MIKQNLGKLDRIFRFVLGVWWIGPLAPIYYTPWLNTIILIIAWIALLESFFGYCMLHDAFGINNKNQ